MKTKSNEIREAVFSEDRKYRYSLSIVWTNKPKPAMVQFIGLNPSTADEFVDDPTVRRCKAFAKSWGYDGMFMSNIFAFRSTDPKVLYATNNPIGEIKYTEGLVLGNWWLLNCAGLSYRSIACWGTHGKFLNRGGYVKALIPKLYCLGLTKEGYPKHPLYLPKNLQPRPYV